MYKKHFFFIKLNKWDTLFKRGVLFHEKDINLKWEKSEKQNVNEEKSQHQMSTLTFILALNL